MSSFVYFGRGVYWRGEAFDLLVSWTLLSFSFALFMKPDVSQLPLSLLYSSVGVGSAFVLHELAHREVAKKYRLAARYRAWYLGLVVTLAVALLNAFIRLPILFAAPGAVVIYGYWGSVSPRAELRIAEAGPLTNIVLSIAAWLILTATPVGTFTMRELIYYIARINVWIAFFNMLPLPPLDGFKVLKRSPIEWIAIFAACVMMLRLVL